MKASLNYDMHLASMRTLADLASVSSDINMRSKAATIRWLGEQFAELQKERDRLAEDLSPTRTEP